MNGKIIIANWKMNLPILSEWSEVKGPDGVEIVICPPFVYLEKLIASASAKGYGGLAFGSQNCFWENQGAYTGEISPVMLKELGAEYVIIGHSERRQILGETDEMVAQKIKAVFENGLTPILCVGETLEQRKKGIQKKIIGKQLEQDLKYLKPKTHNLKPKLLIAYEPVWAIGTGNYCQPEDALEMIKFIKQALKPITYNLKPKVLYGGSVDAKNIAGYVKYPEIDGALVGGASLNPAEFKKIIQNVFSTSN